jgi:hypothetical protein
MKSASDNPEKVLISPSSNSLNQAPTNNGEFIPITGTNPIVMQDSNFVFFFGKPSIGKSVILASMMYYMNARAGSLRPRRDSPNTKEAEVLYFDMLDDLRRGKLPRRSTQMQVTQLNFVFEPNNTSKKVRPINLTFLEMSGEDLQKVRRGGSFDRKIDEYLNAEIPINFILVTDYDNIDDDDSLMISFLNEIEKKSRRFSMVNAILLVSKWDKSGDTNAPDEDYLNNFIAEHMPMTNTQMDNYQLYKSYYTIGKIGEKKDDEGNELIERLNLSTAKMLSEWLYKGITNVDLNYRGTFWERLFGK